MLANSFKYYARSITIFTLGTSGSDEICFLRNSIIAWFISILVGVIRSCFHSNGGKCRHNVDQMNVVPLISHADFLFSWNYFLIIHSDNSTCRNRNKMLGLHPRFLYVSIQLHLTDYYPERLSFSML